jgi:hypothetical protein
MRVFLFTAIYFVAFQINATQQSNQLDTGNIVSTETQIDIRPESTQRLLSEQSQQQRRTIDRSQNDNNLAAKNSSSGYHPDFWIYDAWVSLIGDYDADGYFYRFSVELDADTNWSHAEVYVRFYLGDPQVFEEYHLSSVFSIYGDSSQDTFRLESELLEGVPPYDYDILIELYDAYSDELVAIIDNDQDGDLSYISLESYDYEYVRPDIIVVSRESGGSISSGLWCCLALMGLARRLSTKNPAIWQGKKTRSE